MKSNGELLTEWVADFGNNTMDVALEKLKQMFA